MAPLEKGPLLKPINAELHNSEDGKRYQNGLSKEKPSPNKEKKKKRRKKNHGKKWDFCTRSQFRLFISLLFTQPFLPFGSIRESIYTSQNCFHSLQIFSISRMSNTCEISWAPQESNRFCISIFNNKKLINRLSFLRIFFQKGNLRQVKHLNILSIGKTRWRRSVI